MLFDVAPVERMARDIVSEHGFPIEIVTTADDGRCWRLVVRDTSHRVLDLQILKTESAHELRERLLAQLDAISP